MNHSVKSQYILGALLLVLNGCSTLDKDAPKKVMNHPGAAEKGMLTESSARIRQSYQVEDSAFKLVFKNAEALRWRLAVIDHATTSVDLQVFIWSNDEAGRLMMDRLIKAADRGVKVRLLVDDFPGGWSDEAMFLISQHPNMSMRVFNPKDYRGGIGSSVGNMSNFSELNRRMHNKQMLVDGHWAVLGGRNIGNPYFGLDANYNFRDVDLLITGPILSELESAYDLYWNSDAAFPAERLIDRLSEKKQQKVSKQFAEQLAVDQELLKQTPFPLDVVNWSEQFATLSTTMIPGVATYLQDAPVVRGDRGQRLYDQMKDFSGLGEKDTLIISPYLIPSREMLNSMRENNEKGGSVTILTASLGSNNHTSANSHYKKYRKPLLEGGATIYEFKGQPNAAMRELSDTAPVKAGFISLHVKAFALDKRWVYMGSLNMDPRALEINTEDILAIDSPALAERLIEEARLMAAPENAWSVYLNEKGKVRWQSGDEIRKHQPSRGFGQSCVDWLLRWLPIESQL